MMKGTYTTFDGEERFFNTKPRTFKGEFVEEQNWWYMNDGESLVFLNEDAKNTHGLLVKQWCWSQGWNTTRDGGSVNTFRIVPDIRCYNRYIAFIFEDSDKAMLFKLRWG